MSVATPPTHARHEEGMRVASSDSVADPGLVDRLESEYASMTSEIRSVYKSGRTKSAEWRKQQLKVRARVRAHPCVSEPRVEGAD